MENKRQDIITQMVDALKVSDKKLTQLLLTLMLGSSRDTNIQKQLKGLIAKPNFNNLLKEILDQDFLGRDIEWVLVIPLWKYMKNSNNLYELIFGIGQEISKKDLFLIWDSGKKRISLLNLKFDERRRDTMSLHELHNIATDYGLDMYKVSPHDKPIRYASIENIKEYLKFILRDKENSILKESKHDKFLLKLNHLKTELRHLNITINILKEASLILLKDVYDLRHNIKQERGKISLGYDPYSVVRNFLRFIRMHIETRGGIKNRVRYSKDQEDIIFYDYWQNIKGGTAKSIDDIIKERKYESPSKNQKERLQEEVKHYNPSKSL